MGKTSAVVFSLAVASAGALASQRGKPAPNIPPGYTLVYGNDSMREDNLAPTRGGLEGIHTYDDRGVKARNADLHVSIEDPGNYWPTSRGPWPSMGDISLSEAPPANLASNHAWSWTPPSDKFQTVIAGAPVIDDKRMIFVAATDGLRKFNSDGNVVWHKKSHMGGLAHSASIHGSMVMMSHTNGHVMGLDKETGRVLWSRRHTKESPETGVFPAGYGGKWVFGTEEFGRGSHVRRVVCATDADAPIFPGPLCREFLTATCEPDAEIVAAGAAGTVLVRSLRELLPLPSPYRRGDQDSMKALGSKLGAVVAPPEGDELMAKAYAAAVAKAKKQETQAAVFPVLFAAAVAFSDGRVHSVAELKGIEYGCTVDAVSLLLPEILRAREEGGAPAAVVLQADQFGVAHAPFAAARSLLLEHGFGDVRICGHDDEGKWAAPITVAESLPFSNFTDLFE